MFHRLRQLLAGALGQFTYAPPAWVPRAAAWLHARRRPAAVLLTLLGLLTVAAWQTWCWYQHRPQPQLVSVTVEAPSATPMAKKLEPRPLTLTFSHSVAPLAAVERLVTLPIPMEPACAGTWRWATDRRLVFKPARDWPAGQLYRLRLPQELFTAGVHLEHAEVEATTAPFSASIRKLEFYTDPTQPTTKQITATLEFSHPVDPAELTRQLALQVIGGSPLFPAGAAPFTLTPGLHQRVMHFRTAALKLPEHEDFLQLRLQAALTSTLGGAPLPAAVEQKVRVPDVYSFFAIKETKGQLVENPQGDPEQVLVLTTRGACRLEDVARHLKVFRLPPREDLTDGGQPTEWKSAQEVTPAILAKATPVPCQPIPSTEAQSETHSFRLTTEQAGHLLITVERGLPALGGFLLGEPYANLIPAPEFERTINFEGKGGLLALNGERKLSIRSRGVATIEYEVGRIPADQINHLISQTDGAFEDPDFNYEFGPENLSRVIRERQTIHVTSAGKANYSTFDFTPHLTPATDGGTPLQGLFFLRAQEWVEEEDAPTIAPSPREIVREGEAETVLTAVELAARRRERQRRQRNENRAFEDRFILVTDLGLIVKVHADGTRTVFVASLKTGAQLGGVNIQVLAKNGLPLFTGETAPEGQVALPSLAHLAREQQPVAVVARLGDDVSFMPYARRDRQLDYSRFEIGGVLSAHGSDLEGMIFTERGIYRPGDTLHAGILVKQRDWAGHLAGLPLKVQVWDARGDLAEEQKLALPAGGFAEVSYATRTASPTGQYHLKVLLETEPGKADDEEETVLAETSAMVKEFLPDRMKIEARLEPAPPGGWLQPAQVHALVTLKNLYGTPATERTLKSHLELSTSGFRFPAFKEYQFFDPLAEGKEPKEPRTVELGETETDTAGTARLDLQLERFTDASYALTLATEGFEAEGGRSVSTVTTALVSPLPWVIGTRVEGGQPEFLKAGSSATVEWIALNPQLEKTAVPALECRLVEHSFLSVLEKGEEGNYAYRSVPQATVRQVTPVALPAEGLRQPLPTAAPGHYTLELWQGQQCVSRLTFTVAGRGDVTRSLEKNAELQVTLARPEYHTGEEMELAIVAPYTGSGLITIEKDRVYAHAWFKAESTSTVQHIRVPAGFEGSGYVNVCFLRGLDSKEVFTSPLSYAAIPFQANRAARRLPLTVRAAAQVRPGEDLRITYQTDRPAQVALFAVDEGILQVTDYRLPDPLAHFFRKAALLVETRQIVDLLLPEFSILRQAAAFGGDGEQRLNPFKRVTEQPVVFWSGIVAGGPEEQTVTYHVPEYFSGTLRIMAVALAADAVGATEQTTLVRGPFVLTASAPTVLAPGDEFEAALTVANGVAGSGSAASIEVSATGSEHLEVLTPPQRLPIAEGQEATAVFRVRARERFGAAQLHFRAAVGAESATVRATLSVRPPGPLVTTVQSVHFTGREETVKLERALHADFAGQEATLAATPLGLARGLERFLQAYPHGCSEQITSAAFARLVLASEADFALPRAEVSAQLERTFAELGRRQNDQGAFGYWAAAEKDPGLDFISAYVMQFLLEAKEAGFAPPASLLTQGLKHLRTMAGAEPENMAEARAQALAIYLLTREGAITTNQALNLQDNLRRLDAPGWSKDLAAVYLAGTWAALQRLDDADRLITAYELGHRAPSAWWDFYSPLQADAQYLTILARHFPARLKKITPEEFARVTRPISTGEFTTLSAAYAVLALKSYAHAVAQNAPQLGLAEVRPSGPVPLPTASDALVQRAPFSLEAQSIRFTAAGPRPPLGLFGQVVQTGYDRTLPTQEVRSGLEIFRELRNAQGQPVTTVKLGETITVCLRLRSLRPEGISNVAIVDLLPGGFEFAPGGLEPGAGSAGFEYVDLREDRAVFYGRVGRAMREVHYPLKPVARGTFVVPPPYAEAMYDRTATARGLAGRITVTP